MFNYDRWEEEKTAVKWLESLGYYVIPPGKIQEKIYKFGSFRIKTDILGISFWREKRA